MAAASVVRIDGRVFEIALADGGVLGVFADTSGLIDARDYRAANGAVLRLETRITTIVPPASFEREARR